MGRSANQKRKILLIERLLEATDESHPIAMKEMIEVLAQEGIQSERKSIYGDLEELRAVGMEICFRKAKPMGYYLLKSPENRTDISGSETVCITESGIEEQRKEEDRKDDGCTPDNKMCGKVPSDQEDESGTGNELERENEKEWLQKIRQWEQQEGDYIEVQLRCKRSAFPAVRSRYGENCRIIKEEEKHLLAVVAECPGNLFYGWLVAQGGAVKLVKPKETAKEYRKLLKKILETYK